ncbi:tetratricopeptide repeat protein [Glaesserella sp.]|uniref:tetratricopeptide repeat protein n=1 Tax=Glaesserella sp. TaxID=2094731 RepID=UPI0035A0B0D1
MNKLISVSLTLLSATAAFAESHFEKGSRLLITYNSDYRKAFHAFKQSCEQDKSPSGCYMVAEMYARGWGENYDDDPGRDKADELYQRACDMGEMHACYERGERVETSYDIDGKNYEHARRYFEKACEANVIKACLRLANYYGAGIGGLPIDLQKEMALLNKACYSSEPYYSIGCLTLGAMYEEGRTVPKDLQKAKRFYGMACDDNEAEGCDRYKALHQP